MKRIWAIVGLVAVFALGAGAIFAQTGFGISDACRTVDGQADAVVRIGVPDDAVADGAGVAGCRVIHNGSNYVLSPAVIGDLGVIRRGVQAAVDVFAVNGGLGVTNFGQEVQICLRGTGTFIFLNSNFTPRVPAEMPSVTRNLDVGTYTCTFISSAGIAVLVQGPAAPAEGTVDFGPSTSDGDTVIDAEADDLTVDETAPSETPPITTTAGGGEVLTGCRVTTTAAVRLRSAPTTNSEVITRIPFEFSLQATTRQDGWIQVIWEDGQGWISDDFLRQSPGCFN
jgi:hypothetical protein